jgi:hypothetical protein
LNQSANASTHGIGSAARRFRFIFGFFRGSHSLHSFVNFVASNLRLQVPVTLFFFYTKTFIQHTTAGLLVIFLTSILALGSPRRNRILSLYNHPNDEELSKDIGVGRRWPIERCPGKAQDYAGLTA